ncbi:tyrosine-type recombinase/integrase [Virgibacillus sp. AGTR]|uniref:tyrosine-type recombinase/integrase n=1 Tax=Virgibacillus sp. AGTR TaxID=2812055 RepID=UPI001D1604CE|nr:tyrosine-type recombinase/integrase [Virgibacillus sp. AGTR]MCC2250365.1 tyrosine-type recombinase/integrase [Virgibacillus sp. AGTR]
MSKKTYIAERSGFARPTADRHVQRHPNVLHSPDMKISEALEVFVQAKRAEGCRERTVGEYYRHISYIIDYLGEDILLDNLTPDMIRSYISYLLSERKAYEGDNKRQKDKKGLSPNTINIRLRTLKTMCRFWYQEGYMLNNPMSTIKLVKSNHVPEVQGLTDEQVRSVLNYYDERMYSEWRDKTLVYLLLDTGLRIQEAVSLTIGQIEVRQNLLVIPSEIAKNRKYRDVPVSREIVKQLLELYQESRRYFGNIDRIFMNSYGEPLKADTFRRRLNRLKKKIGMDTLHPHQFRHTFARDYLLNGGDLFTLQRILDHADIKTTRKYIQMDTEHIQTQHLKHSPVRKYIRRR